MAILPERSDPETFVKGLGHSGSDRNRSFPTSGRGAPDRDTMPPVLRPVRAFRCIGKGSGAQPAPQ